MGKAIIGVLRLRQLPDYLVNSRRSKALAFDAQPTAAGSVTYFQTRGLNDEWESRANAFITSDSRQGGAYSAWPEVGRARLCRGVRSGVQTPLSPSIDKSLNSSMIKDTLAAASRRQKSARPPRASAPGLVSSLK